MLDINPGLDSNIVNKFVSLLVTFFEISEIIPLNSQPMQVNDIMFFFLQISNHN